MRKHFESKKNSFERDDSNDHRKHKKLSAYREEKNWKNHLFDESNTDSDEKDLFNYNEEEDE